MKNKILIFTIIIFILTINPVYAHGADFYDIQNHWGKDYIETLVNEGGIVGYPDEYPKFPLETLYDQGGDCEDSSILLASLLRELGYGTVLVMTEDHMGVGIKASEQANFTSVNSLKYREKGEGILCINLMKL